MTEITSSNPAEESSAGHSMRLTTALLIVTAVSLVMVGFSYVLYTKNSRYKYDIARPDAKSAGSSLSGGEVDDTTTPVNEATIIKTQELIENYTKTLETLNDFDENPVSNQSLNLTENTSPSL